MAWSLFSSPFRAGASHVRPGGDPEQHHEKFGYLIWVNLKGLVFTCGCARGTGLLLGGCQGARVGVADAVLALDLDGAAELGVGVRGRHVVGRGHGEAARRRPSLEALLFWAQKHFDLASITLHVDLHSLKKSPKNEDNLDTSSQSKILTSEG